MNFSKGRLILFGAILAIVSPGCFYPPSSQPPPEDKTTTIVPLPFDLAWTAVNNVIHANGYNVQAKDPNHGIIEVLGRSFSLRDADCGKIKSIVGMYPAEPHPDSTSVFNFHVKPVSNESTRVAINATFDSPLNVPLHPMRDEQCISRGAEESRLLQQILAQASVTRAPVYKNTSPPPKLPQGYENQQSTHPTLLSPGILKKPGS
ncbi:MAG: hypothetical protein ACYDC3_17465 [Candidatus Binataceae bacterium]